MAGIGAIGATGNNPWAQLRPYTYSVTGTVRHADGSLQAFTSPVKATNAAEAERKGVSRAPTGVDVYL